MTPETQLIITIASLLGIGGLVTGLVKYIFNRERGLMMTKENHLIACDKAKTDIRAGIKEEFTDFRDYFKREVEFKVLESLRNLNGTLEEKIQNIVSREVKPLAGEISKRLDLVEVVKTLIKEKP